MSMIDFFQQHSLYYFTVIFIFGLCLGSFLNVVIYRLPIVLQRKWRAQCVDFLNLPASANEEALDVFNLCSPRSHCVHCKRTLPFFLNIPLLGFLVQRAKCRFCKKKISWRYPCVEFLASLLSLACAWQWGVSWTTLAALLFCLTLLALVFIDLDVLLLPDSLTLPLLWLGLFFSVFSLFISSQEAILGALLGYLVLWSIAKIFHYFAGVEGMGAGDFKLNAALGAWLGWQYLPWLLSLSAILALLVGGGLMLRKKLTLRSPIPFGPFLAMAGLIFFFWGKPLGTGVSVCW
ncbi:MAG: prepilin peptidase [Gammaproteobacteria bacterium]|nr:prepilin peptidase [Gammaproteobacteria bacterium]